MTTVLEVPLPTIDCVRFVVIEGYDLVKNRGKSFHGYARWRQLGAEFIDFCKALRIQEDNLEVVELVRLAIAGRGAAR
ncbi:MAG: hypothetical protein ACE5NA_09170 [Nitrospiraceae bacterium]